MSSVFGKTSDGAWGDHVAVQGISNMLNININVFSTIGETITVACPTSGGTSLLKTINIGLIYQSHYVGLDLSNTVAEILGGRGALAPYF